MSRIENLRSLKGSLEVDPHISLLKVGESGYRIVFNRGDTKKLPGKAWGRVIDGVDPSKKGGYALQGKRWIHSNNVVRNGDIVAYNVPGSGERGNFEDLYVSAIVDGEAYVLAFCNWSDRNEKQGMIEDLDDLLKRIDSEEGEFDEFDVERRDGSLEELIDTVRDFGREKQMENRRVSDFIEYRTMGQLKDGCIVVKTDIIKMLKLRDDDFVIVTIEVPYLKK